jgi:hypothetical protein
MSVRYMRIKIIGPLILISSLLCWLLLHRHQQEVRIHAVPQIIVPQKQIASVETDFQTVVPATATPAETPTERVLSKLRAWDDDDNPDLREQRIQELAALLSGTNAWEMIQGIPSNLMGYVFAVPSVRERMMADPVASLDWMSQHPNVQSQLQTFLHDWSQSDKAVMQQTIAALPGGPWKEQVVTAAANEALTTDPASAVGLAMQMNVAPQQNPWLDMAMTEWAKRDPSAAAQQANQAGNAPLQQQLFKDVAIGLANSNPQQAADFASQFITDAKTLNDSLGEITWAWALQDPASASAWLAQLPEGDAQQGALQNLMSVWGNHDPNAATTWVENLPQGSFQTRAATALLPVVSR